jgi:hypothetical protein
MHCFSDCGPRQDNGIRSEACGSFDYRRAPGEHAPEWTRSLALLVRHDGGGVSGKTK